MWHSRPRLCPGISRKTVHSRGRLCHTFIRVMLSKMEIRPATMNDLEALREIDGTIESRQYFHLDLGDEDGARSWRLEERPLREQLIEANRMDDEAYFVAKQ